MKILSHLIWILLLAIIVSSRYATKATEPEESQCSSLSSSSTAECIESVASSTSVQKKTAANDDDAPAYFENVTLSSSACGKLSVTIFLPNVTTSATREKPMNQKEHYQSNKNRIYYKSSRFDHSSMIGSIQFSPSSLKESDRHAKRPREQQQADSSDDRSNNSVGNEEERHTMYGGELWRIPHDPKWPESGLGLASEFGFGSDGAFCDKNCGWHRINSVTNGVLGYMEAQPGEAFLKIGVGALVKGSCPDCDDNGPYKFNSPYQFYSSGDAPPAWDILEQTSEVLMIQHEVILMRHADGSTTVQESPSAGRSTSKSTNHSPVTKRYGYRLTKTITMMAPNELRVQTALRNLGQDPFKTAWYSHHFFTCDGHPVGPGYSVDLDMKAQGGIPTDRQQSHGTMGENVNDNNVMYNNVMYEEPGVGQWAQPLTNYATVKVKSDPAALTDDQILIDWDRIMDKEGKILALFAKDAGAKGSFALHGCDTTIQADVMELSQEDAFRSISLYGFNMYVERGTLSPEPQFLISLEPQEMKTWTQRLVFS